MCKFIYRLLHGVFTGAGSQQMGLEFLRECVDGERRSPQFDEEAVPCKQAGAGL